MECIWVTTEFVEILNEKLTKVFYLVRVKHFVFSAMKITQPIFEINWRMICWRLFTVIPSFTLCAPSLCWTIWVIQKSVVIKLTRVFTVAWFVFLSIFLFLKIISIFFGAKNNKVQNTFKAIYQLNLAGIKIVYNIVLCLKLIILFGKIHKMDEIFTFLLFLFFEKYYSKKI